MLKFLKNLVDDKRGASAVEYALLAALVIIAAVGAVKTLGSSVSAQFLNIASSIGS